MERLSSQLDHYSTQPMTDIDNLKAHASWIRDVLDPTIARDGPEAISVEDALFLDQYLRRLRLAAITIYHLRQSRFHLAAIEIAGKATRWPRQLIERAEALISTWESKFGSLSAIGIELLGSGGRLEGLPMGTDLHTDSLLVTWLKQGVKILPARARKWGDLGFAPGDWWINSLFAFKAGIIDSADPSGSITADDKGAYALLLSGSDEMPGPSAERFTYRSHAEDKGRYRLTSATRDGRQPVRVLRCHDLHSLWCPRVGVRYDGLYKVAGWSIKFDKKTKQTRYDIDFERHSTSPSMEDVLNRPSTDEIEDFLAFEKLSRTTSGTTLHSKLQLPVRAPALSSNL